MRYLKPPRGSFKASPPALCSLYPPPRRSTSCGIGMAEPATDTILVLNGPNLNMLGTREPEKYGHASLADIEALCRETAATFGLKADCRQSNREGELIDFIHEAHARKMKGIIINAGGYSHTSIAL